MGVSLRAYARMRGCSLTAVQKAISSKRITTLADGTIDPERANQDWAKNTFAGQTIHKASAASSDRLPPVHESAVGSGDPVPRTCGRGLSKRASRLEPPNWNTRSAQAS